MLKRLFTIAIVAMFAVGSSACTDLTGADDESAGSGTYDDESAGSGT